MTADLFNGQIEPARDLALSQWFTPPWLAARMAGWCWRDLLDGRRVLEPSAGRGALVAAVRDEAPHAHVTAYEVDPRHAAYLREAYPHGVSVREEDYLAASAPLRRYGLALVNSPYEGGADGRFLEKAMRESDRVVALIRIVALAGIARHGAVWGRVGDGAAWEMEGMAILVKRPNFGGAGNAKADFVAVKLARRELSRGRGCKVEWWEAPR